jgi:catechol 2,3-dioxygenase-like lactoylglutathione lyase family enzyme
VARPHLTHVALHVRDLAACVAFYADYCGLRETHRRGDKVVWLAEPGRQRDFVMVLLAGGAGREQPADDFSHLGFAVATRDTVDAVADRARRDGTLVWEPREDAYPVGY